MSVKKWSSHDVYEALKDVTLGGKICLYTPEICEKLAPKINRILELKEEKDAVLLAHSYVVPEIVRCVADFVGDSYGLSKQVKTVSQKTIVFAAVKFMAETAKLLNPEKRVVVPSSLSTTWKASGGIISRTSAIGPSRLTIPPGTVSLLVE